MAANYIGYGINTYDLDNEQLVKFIRDYAPKTMRSCSRKPKKTVPTNMPKIPKKR